MHIYAFGSICRGDLTKDSDVDLLALVSEPDSRVNPEIFSVYSYQRIRDLWAEGNPFAWHLFSESKLIFSPDAQDWLKTLGKPASYLLCPRDCNKFFQLFLDAALSLKMSLETSVFDLSTIFLSIRNFATCYALGELGEGNFARSSALALGVSSLPISPHTFSVFERARILSTRGRGENLTELEIRDGLSSLPTVESWMQGLLSRVRQR